MGEKIKAIVNLAQWLIANFGTDIDDPTRGIWIDGIGFDGSSIRGFQQIQESDMILMPDPETAVIDPVCEIPTLSIVCDIL